MQDQSDLKLFNKKQINSKIYRIKHVIIGFRKKADINKIIYIKM